MGMTETRQNKGYGSQPRFSMNRTVLCLMNMARPKPTPAVVGSLCTLLSEPNPPVLVLRAMHLCPCDAVSALNKLC